MTAKSTAPVTQPWSSCVEMVAAANGVDQYLLPLYEMTRRAFPAGDRQTVTVEDDQECEGDWRNVFAVETSLGVSQAVQAVRQWYGQLFECCPPPAVCFFRLGLKVSHLHPAS
jgi:hypothetical protein